MRPILTVCAVLALMLGFVPNVGIVQATRPVHASGPTNNNGVPWIQVYQVDPRAVAASDHLSTFTVVYDTRQAGEVEELRLCYDYGQSRGCATTPFGFDLGGSQWSSRFLGWEWFGLGPRPKEVYAQATILSPHGQRETVSTHPILVQPNRAASGEVWPYVDLAPQRLGDPMILRIERDLGLPIAWSEICFGRWTCHYESVSDWGMALNGAGVQLIDALILGPPNTVRQGPNGKLLSFPDGAQIRVRYTMINGSSVEYWHQPLRFLP